MALLLIIQTGSKEPERGFRVECGNETCHTNTRLPYRSKLIAMIANRVLNASMYVPLTNLLDISNYSVVSAEIWMHIGLY